MKATEQAGAAPPCSVDESLMCDHSNESYCAVLSCGAVYYAAHGGFHFSPCISNPNERPLDSCWNEAVEQLLFSTFQWCNVVLMFESSYRGTFLSVGLRGSRFVTSVFFQMSSVSILLI